MFIKCDVNSIGAPVSEYTWSSSQPGNEDYDMPLRISPSRGLNGVNSFPLLVTGAANANSPNLGSILVMKFNQGGLLITSNSFVPTNYAMSYQPAKNTSVYGVDIRGPIDTNLDSTSGDYVVLVNYFDETTPDQKSWGILRIKNNLTNYGPGTDSYIGLRGRKSWANQFLDVKFDTTVWATVLGQQIDLYSDTNTCNITISAPSKNPGFANVNPFLARMNVESPHWGASGFSGLPGFFVPNTLQLSSQGTYSTDLDYLQGSVGVANSSLEDVSRLYTFGAVAPYYNTLYTTSQYRDPAMVVPVADDTSAVTYAKLHTKFISTNTSFQETDCNKYIEDCPGLFVSSTDAYGMVLSYINSIYSDNAYNIFNVIDALYMPITEDCSNDYYKPTGVAHHSRRDDIRVYPNPTSRMLNVNIPAGVGSGPSVFRLSDISGRVVFERNDITNGVTSVELPDLASGVYVVVIELDKLKYVQRLVIE